MDFGLNIKAEPVSGPLPESFSAGSFLQAPFWAEFKGKYGWKSFFFKLEVSSAVLKRPLALYFSVLVRKFLKCFSLAYIPMAPASVWFSGCFATDGFSAADFFSEFILKAAVAVKPFLPRDTFCIRLDPDIDRDVFPGKIPATIPGQPLKLLKAPSDIQPPDTVILNLEQGPDSVFSGMKPKWRYNIRLAGKKGVEVLCFRGHEALETKSGDSSPLDIFYRLYEETAERDGISIHGKNYYRSLFEVASAGHSGADIRLYAARHENDNLASIITVFYKGTAVYLYGASGGKKRAFMPAYALQWQAIQDAYSSGCCAYDFYGIPPAEDEKHPMHGLYRFKTGFGGEIIHRAGSLDVPLKNTWYTLYRLAESLRAFWFKRAVKFLKRR